MGNSSGVSPYGQQGSSANLADILERVLDKGIVIAGDIKINLLDIELLTIKLRLLVASVDKAKEMGIDWWEHDPSLSSRARPEQQLDGGSAPSGDGQPQGALAEENARLRAEIAELRGAAGLTAGSDAHTPEPLPGTAGEAEGEERQ
ncbi:gas vesicle protein [Streptomyces sp. NPDC020403]